MPTRKIGFGEAVKLFFKNYVNFSGRATRSEYWWVYLFNNIVYMVLGILFAISGGSSLAAYDAYGDMSIAYMGAGAIFYILMMLYSLAVLLPSLSLMVPPTSRHRQERYVYIDGAHPGCRLHIYSRIHAYRQRPR